ncbi:MAG: triose-phosphate isomerase [Peptococcaceae bacterium]|nr:triose-phosphate isomerase [Peptococcaceae bacterium]
MRIPLIAGNWKMYKTVGEAIEFARELISFALPDSCKVVICPPATAIFSLWEAFRGTSIELGGQNMHYSVEGPYTGELSPAMLREAGCKYVILGHSERRQYFAETDRAVSKKALSALENSLIPIVCVGETLEQREAGLTSEVISGQFRDSLQGLTAGQITGVVLAYEPVWAIGTGKTASDIDAQQVNGLIRKLLVEKFGSEAAEKVSIIYGGSVKPDNVRQLLAQPDIDGALVGGASLDAKSFAEIIIAAGVNK